MEKKIEVIQNNLGLLKDNLKQCTLCPRRCRVNRLKESKGYCRTSDELIVYTAFLHKGEEPPVSGNRGSGTVFFSGCNLRCIYCQNYKFSHLLEGKIINKEECAKILLNLQEEGAENINLVTPTHFLPQILESLLIAFKQGLKIPIVYNTSGYENKEIIELIGDIVDIYLVDMRYISSSLAGKYSNAPDYPFFNQESIREMCKQKKNHLWEGNLLKEGVIIRHLVLPTYVGETKKILSWIKENVPQALVSVMFQYHPYFKANSYPEINRRINLAEYKEVIEFLERLDIDGWVQDLYTQENLAGVYFKPSFFRKFSLRKGGKN